MTDLTMEEYDSEEGKRSKEEKVPFMTLYERPHDPRSGGSSVRETAGRSLFRPVHVRVNVGASAEYLCQNAERR